MQRQLQPAKSATFVLQPHEIMQQEMKKLSNSDKVITVMSLI